MASIPRTWPIPQAWPFPILDPTHPDGGTWYSGATALGGMWYGHPTPRTHLAHTPHPLTRPQIYTLRYYKPQQYQYLNLGLCPCLDIRICLDVCTWLGVGTCVCAGDGDGVWGVGSGTGDGSGGGCSAWQPIPHTHNLRLIRRSAWR
jgi:hypothetical protein